eukprot:CAMPEP_0201283340 /NCGR_PEP_ID=MMETSP1317-20130820/8309_1 /ASSEMBLY_ACC=CAM_ASM_000770 /TAXON_ID=187299 /ORGANISM="Undescribed Undescribed, Strain Undescribed" /LENGTH=43 /DNA_ID= /DNA_START= /DNA_END= /DNA_ORIENTATION=
MNNFPNLGTAYRGRILLKIYSYDEKKPKMLKVTELEEACFKEV